MSKLKNNSDNNETLNSKRNNTTNYPPENVWFTNRSIKWSTTNQINQIIQLFIKKKSNKIK